jgi:hypothetical protein
MTQNIYLFFYDVRWKCRSYAALLADVCPYLPGAYAPGYKNDGAMRLK